MSKSIRTSRRSLLAGFAASPIAMAGVGAFPSQVRAQASSVGLITPNVCMVTPEVTEGPYYLDEDLVRAEIAEDRDGVPLRMMLQVVTADCTPVEGARVDIWHCDAAGNYSGYATQGSDGTEDTSDQTFLRGTQTTGANGSVTFETIYPGWYRGRTTHIHYKVFLDERTVLTSQVFFPDALSEYLFQTVPPYNDRADSRDTTNRNDRIAKQAGEGAYASVREQYARYDAALVVGIDETAVSEPMGPGGPGGGDWRGGPPRGGPDGARPPGGRGSPTQDGSGSVFIPGRDS